MIIVKIWGGLGNQMFQYAAGKALAHRLNCDLKLDLTPYNERSNATPREFQLQVFPNDYNIASEEEIAEVLGILKFKPALRLYNLLKLSKVVGVRYLTDSNFIYNDAFNAVTKDCYLDGYWQSFKYPESIKDVIVQEFKFPDFSGSIQDIEKRVLASDAVSLHVRRGDYVSNKSTNEYHGVCDLEYYHRAVAYIKSKAPDSCIFVFSDDIDWAIENLRLPGEHVFVANSNGHPASDMRLMSLCKHNIIANSSFSWWAAWLNQWPGKIVISPAKWFNVNLSTKDLIPQQWIRI